MSLKKFLKRAKKQVSKGLQTLGTVAIKAVKYAAPLAGTLLAGPIGGAAGTALATVAATHRAKNKGKAALRAAALGAAVTGGVTAIGSLIRSAAKPAAGKSSLDGALLTDKDGPEFDGGSVLGRLGDSFLGGGGQGPDILGTSNLPDTATEEPTRPEDDGVGQPGGPTSGASSKTPLLVGAAVVGLLLMSKK